MNNKVDLNMKFNQTCTTLSSGYTSTTAVLLSGEQLRAILILLLEKDLHCKVLAGIANVTIRTSDIKVNT